MKAYLQFALSISREILLLKINFIYFVFLTVLEGSLLLGRSTALAVAKLGATL